MLGVRVLSLAGVTVHCLLAARALRCRPCWRFDLASYVDVLCLFGGILVAPIYCLVRYRGSPQAKGSVNGIGKSP